MWGGYSKFCVGFFFSTLISTERLLPTFVWAASLIHIPNSGILVRHSQKAVKMRQGQIVNA